MSWYYAGPDAKPVGPVSLEELHLLRLAGTVTPETYVIEQTGEPGAWRHYREVFPSSASLPPLPTIPPPVPLAVARPAVIAPAVPAATAHPLFPSAAHAPTQPAPPLMAAPHAHYPIRRTNAWCAWGFGLGIAGFLFTFLCGIGLLLSIPGLLVCILGFTQVQRHPEESGRGLALVGGVLSVLSLLISISFLVYAVPVMIKEHQWTVTEQSSSNSE